MGILPILLGISPTNLLTLSLGFLRPQTLYHLLIRPYRLLVIYYQVLVQIGLCR